MKTIRKAIRHVGLSSLILATGAASAYASTGMKVRGYTTQPIGHFEFCKAVPAECDVIGKNINPQTLSRSLWSKIVAVNNQVNTSVRPLTDMEIWGREEVWSYPEAVGDCEDYVLLKRAMLMRAGISAGNLLVTVVRQSNGDGHAVLTVRTDRGDFILDNLVGEIRDWRDTNYRFLKRQSSDHAGRWVTISDNRANLARN